MGMFKKEYKPIFDNSYVLSLEELKQVLPGKWTTSGTILSNLPLEDNLKTASLVGDNKVDIEGELYEIIDINTIVNRSQKITSANNKCKCLQGTVYKSLIAWNNGVTWVKLEEKDCYCPPCDDCYCPPNTCFELVFNFGEQVYGSKNGSNGSNDNNGSDNSNVCNGNINSAPVCKDCRPCPKPCKPCPPGQCTPPVCQNPKTVEIVLDNIQDILVLTRLKDHLYKMTEEEKKCMMRRLLQYLS